MFEDFQNSENSFYQVEKISNSQKFDQYIDQNENDNNVYFDNN